MGKKEFIKSSLNSVLTKFKDVNSGKSAILLATGPSTSKFPLSFIDDNNIDLTVGIKQFIRFPGLTNLDYYFFGDLNARSLPDLLYLSKNPIKIGTKFAITLADGENNGRMLASKDAITYFNAIPLEITDKRTFIRSVDKYCMVKCSTVFPALQFLLFSGVTTIYLVGCDCTNQLSFLEPDKLKQSIKKDKFPDGMVAMWQKFKIFVKTEYPNVKIISVNPVELKEVFSDVYT